MAIGANVGTTATAMLGAIGGTPDKKRVAAAHVLFNVATAVVAFSLLVPLNYLIENILGMQDEPVIALALFHTLFNVLGVVLFVAFIPLLSTRLQRLFHTRHSAPTKYIQDVDPTIAEASVVALKNETSHFLKESMRFALLTLNIPPKEILDERRKASAVVYSHPGVIELDLDEAYERLKKASAAILDYASMIRDHSHEEGRIIDDCLTATRELIHGVREIKNVKAHLDTYAESSKPFLIDRYNKSQLIIARLFKNLMPIIDKGRHDEEIEVDKKLRKLFEEIETNDKEALKIISHAIRNGELAQGEAPSFIATNRAIHTLSDSITEAIRQLFHMEDLWKKEKHKKH